MIRLFSLQSLRKTKISFKKIEKNGKNGSNSFNFRSNPLEYQFNSFQWNGNGYKNGMEWNKRQLSSSIIGSRKEIFDNNKQHFEPSPYIQTLEHLGRKGYFDEMEKMIENRKSRGLELDLRTYSILINVYGKASNFDKIREIMAEMSVKGIKPDVVLYTNIIKLSGDNDMWELMESTFIHMKKRGIDPGLKAYSTMLGCLARKRDLKAVLETMEEMKADGVKPDIFVYNILLRVLGQSDLIDAMQDCYLKMQRDKIGPNIITFGILANQLGRRFEWERLKKVYDEMKENGIFPNQVIFNTIIRWSTAASDEKLTTYWLNRLQQDGLKKSYTIYLLLFAFARKESNSNLVSSLVREIFTTADHSKERDKIQNLSYFIWEPQLRIEWNRFFGFADDYVVSNSVVFFNDKNEEKESKLIPELEEEIKGFD